MSKKWSFLYIIALVLLPILLFIITQLELPAELMEPPGLYGENAKIQQAFEKSIENPEDVNLKYPSEGEYNSAFVLYDIDSDNRDEAIVFYSYKNDESTVRVNVLDYIDGTWTSVFDEEGYGSDILSVDFNDFDGNGNYEVICCWKLIESTTSKTLTVHKVLMSDNKVDDIKTLVNQAYSFYCIEDMDCDGEKEIMVSWLDSTDVKNPKAFASLLKLDMNGDFKLAGDKVQLDSSVATYTTLAVDKISDIPYVFVDSQNGENSMITEIIYWNSKTESLEAPFNDDSAFINYKTKRTPAVASKDIDGDGHVEIPVAVSNDEYPLICWYSFDGNSLNAESYCFVNTAHDYYYVVDSSVKEQIVASFAKETGTLSIYNSSFGAQGDLLFTIASNDGGKNLIISVTEAGERLGFTEELIKKNVERG